MFYLYPFYFQKKNNIFPSAKLDSAIGGDGNKYSYKSPQEFADGLEKVEVHVFIPAELLKKLNAGRFYRKGKFLTVQDFLETPWQIRKLLNYRRPFLKEEDIKVTFNVPGLMLRPQLLGDNSNVLSFLNQSQKKILHLFIEPKAKLGDELPYYLQGMPDPSACTSYSMVSFYSFIKINSPKEVIDKLTKDWKHFEALGRVYVAEEGINAQMAIPSNVLSHFKECVKSEPFLSGALVNDDRDISREQYEDLLPFRSLHIRQRKQILADGIELQKLQWTERNGIELDADSFHAALDNPSAVVLDCRNKYESDVGRFQGAVPLNTETFKDSWEAMSDILKDTPKDTPILTYCTGGIRCVKIDAYLQQAMGFNNVYRLKGGIVNYVKAVETGLIRGQSAPGSCVDVIESTSKFRGVNFVFDERICSRVTNDVLSSCKTCGEPCDTYINCHNADCDVCHRCEFVFDHLHQYVALISCMFNMDLVQAAAVCKVLSDL